MRQNAPYGCRRAFQVKDILRGKCQIASEGFLAVRGPLYYRLPSKQSKDVRLKMTADLRLTKRHWVGDKEAPTLNTLNPKP